MSKMALFIATQKGYESLCSILDNGRAEQIGLVISFEETAVEMSYDGMIEDKCNGYSIPYYSWKNCKDQLNQMICLYEISCAAAIGWRFIIPLDINEHMKYPLMVFHDSLLPKYRGFAPTPTAMICGEHEIGVTILVVTEYMDEGDIIQQRSMLISEDEYIKAVIERQSKLYGDMLLELLEAVQNDAVKTLPQDHTQATYSVWRDISDCHINWKKSANEIYALIRAVSSPYLGAYFYYNNKKLTINRARIVKDIQFAIRDCGKIWNIDAGAPTVICGEGLIKLLEVVDESGETVTFSRLRERFY